MFTASEPCPDGGVSRVQCETVRLRDLTACGTAPRSQGDSRDTRLRWLVAVAATIFGGCSRQVVVPFSQKDSRDTRLLVSSSSRRLKSVRFLGHQTSGSRLAASELCIN